MRHIAADRLAALMPDIGRHASECRFYNCTHRHEPGLPASAHWPHWSVARSLEIAALVIYREFFEVL